MAGGTVLDSGCPVRAYLALGRTELGFHEKGWVGVGLIGRDCGKCVVDFFCAVGSKPLFDRSEITCGLLYSFMHVPGYGYAGIAGQGV